MLEELMEEMHGVMKRKAQNNRYLCRNWTPWTCREAEHYNNNYSKYYKLYTNYMQIIQLNFSINSITFFL